MPRNDMAGFFWDDTPPPKPPKAEKLKRIPPEPVWLRPDYLPGLEEARAFPADILTIEGLLHAATNREEMVVDVECFPNYFLVVFTSVLSGSVFYLETWEGGPPLDKELLRWILMAFTTTGFNSNSYDIPMLNLAIAGYSVRELKTQSDRIIKEEIRGNDILRFEKVKAIKVDHIDLIEVAPLFASLKTYAGRLHAKKMQDLPFHESTSLSWDQITIVRWYCVNDTRNTELLRLCLREHIDLRYQLSNEYKVDLRSKSDAQIAEAVIAAELTRRTGVRPQKPKIDIGTAYRYKVPPYMKFQSGLMNWALNIIENAYFIVDHTGSIAMPEEIKALKLDINGSVYRMGIGGLHSSETTAAHYTDKDYVLIDKDVTSYYPFIILNLGLAPVHLGMPFLQVYRSIVERRIQAKTAGNKVIADSLKIVVNGSFGKLGSQYSILYSPDLLIQVTVTGQLSLLMLIERIELAGIRVVSANTDGIVIKCPRGAQATLDAIVKQWEIDTGYPTEETRYMALYSRDVNNYIAVKQKEVKNPDGSITWVEENSGTKNKGAYNNPWNNSKNTAERLVKNPTATICVEAVEAYVTKGIPVTTTIRGCKDIKKFVAVRSVKGGAVKVWNRLPPPPHESKEALLMSQGWVEFAKDSWSPDQSFKSGIFHVDKAYAAVYDQLSAPGRTDYLGKTVRWYYGRDVPGEMVYASSGNKVPRSDGAVPLMQLPEAFPQDVDFDWYETEAGRILTDVGAIA